MSKIIKPEDKRKPKNFEEDDDEVRPSKKKVDSSSEEESPKKKSPKKPTKHSKSDDEDKLMDSDEEPPRRSKKTESSAKRRADSDDDVPKKKSSKHAEVSSDEDSPPKKRASKAEVSDDSPPKKKSKASESPRKKTKKGDDSGKKKSLSKDELKHLIESKINRIRKEEDKKEFIFLEGVDSQRTEKRYKWLWEQIGSSGLKCRSTRKQFEDCKWYCIGTTKRIDPVFLWPGDPNAEFKSPTEVMRAYAKAVDIDVKTIKGWDQSQVFISKIKGSDPVWMLTKEIWPTDYRGKGAKSRGGSAKSVTKRRSKEDDESDVEDVPRKKNKIERVVEYSKTLNELFLTKDVADDAADQILRFQMVKGALNLSSEEIKIVIKKMNAVVNAREEEKVEEQKREEEEESVVDLKDIELKEGEPESVMMEDVASVKSDDTAVMDAAEEVI